MRDASGGPHGFLEDRFDRQDRTPSRYQALLGQEIFKELE
jgi:hypothetical protein